MKEELELLKKMLPQMAEIMNVVPGERVHFKDSETLGILERRMTECDVKKELHTFNAIFGMREGATTIAIHNSCIAYLKIRLLVNQGKLDFDPWSVRDLIKEYQAQLGRTSNLIQLSKMNLLTASAYQKERIELLLEKSESFVKVLQIEIDGLKKQIERLPKEEDDKADVSESPVDEIAAPKKNAKEKKERFSFIAFIKSKIQGAKDERVIAEELKETEKGQSKTSCKEIPYYDRSLSEVKNLLCRDASNFSLLSSKNSIYYGKSGNVNGKNYDNTDGSLLELTEATPEFVQFMTEDLLSDEYELDIFSPKDKKGLFQYYEFMNYCFENHIGMDMSVQEYLHYKSYYNRLVMKMFALEEQKKQDYYKGLFLADKYLSYMKAYGLCCMEDKEQVTANITDGMCENYISDLDLIVKHHMVEKEAIDLLELLKQELFSFKDRANGVLEGEEKKDVDEEETDVSCEITMPDFSAINMIPPDVGVRNLTDVKIVIQILNEEAKLTDEAVYAIGNMKQAMLDYDKRSGAIKRMGFRMNGQDLFFKEER